MHVSGDGKGSDEQRSKTPFTAGFESSPGHQRNDRMRTPKIVVRVMNRFGYLTRAQTHNLTLCAIRDLLAERFPSGTATAREIDAVHGWLMDLADDAEKTGNKPLASGLKQAADVAARLLVEAVELNMPGTETAKSG